MHVAGRVKLLHARHVLSPRAFVSPQSRLRSELSAQVVASGWHGPRVWTIIMQDLIAQRDITMTARRR
jgi:hypothetical protein